MAITLDQLKGAVFAGESGGDYNALYGYANRPNGRFADTRLTDMTVNQALEFSDPSGPYAQSVKAQIGRVATPMGAYQVVGSTLRDAARGLGLTGNERMTQDLQDKIGMWIYQNQGPSAWEAWGKGGGSNSSLNLSTRGGAMPMGLLDDEPQTFGQRLKRDFQSGELMDRVALAANSLRLRPDANLAQMVQGRQEARADRNTLNRTAQWLASQGREDLAQAMMTGALDPKTAVATAMTPADQVSGIEVGGKLVDPRTGQVLYDPTGGGQTLTPEQLTMLNPLRDDATQATKELGAVKSAYTDIQTFYENQGAVSDRALVIAFAKVLDPTSVVRESEAAALANAGSLEAGLRSTLLNTLQGGGNLPPQIRTEIAQLARELYNSRIGGVQARVDMLKETARRAGLPPELVFSGDFAPPPALTPSAPPPPPAGVRQGPPAPPAGGRDPDIDQYIPR